MPTKKPMLEHMVQVRVHQDDFERLKELQEVYWRPITKSALIQKILHDNLPDYLEKWNGYKPRRKGNT